jgi:putative spermidine/putrescine transport system ATP-binding protein
VSAGNTIASRVDAMRDTRADPAANHLTLAGVTKRFDSVAAVRDVSLTLPKGELVCLLGPSGCGKTTILNLVAGYLRPDAGAILLQGRPIQDLPPRHRNMGMVFQSYALFPHMTAEDNVAFGLEARRVGRAERRKRALRMLDLVGLAQMERRLPRELSGGQQQRVALARALLIEPDVLLLDEPFSNLDAHLRKQMREEVRAIQRRTGITTLFVTHDQEEAMAISDRVAVVNQGRVEQVDLPRRLYGRPETLFVATFLGEANVLPGKVVTSRGGVMEIEVNGVVLRAQAGGHAPMPGARGLFCVRPERVYLTPSEPDHRAEDTIAVDGKVVECAFLGTRNRYLITTKAGPFVTIGEDVGAPLEIGAAVRISWDTTNAWVFAADAPGASPPVSDHG